MVTEDTTTINKLCNDHNWLHKDKKLNNKSNQPRSTHKNTKIPTEHIHSNSPREYLIPSIDQTNK